MRLHDHKILALLLCLPDCLSRGNAKRLCCIVLRKYDTMPFLHRTAHCHRLVLQFRVQHTLDRGIEIIHIIIQNYELGSRKPSNMVTIQKIADALNTTTEYLRGSSGTYVVEAHEKGGAKAAKDIEELVSEVTGMFAGGELSEDAIEGAYKALTDAYWIAKENNKKYAPKTRRKKSDQ